MPHFEWTPALAIGIRSIDEQHKRLVELVNQMQDALEESEDQCPALDLVDRLKTYASEHFHIEEGYMQAFGYPECAAHTREHERFTSTVQDLEGDCLAGRASAEDVLAFLKAWLGEHITGEDVRMGRFLEDYLR